MGSQLVSKFGANQIVVRQVLGLVRFNINEEPLMEWDRQVRSACQSVNDIIDSMQAKGFTTDIA